jgi:membrane protein DedA with SNARE-associated domain
MLPISSLIASYGYYALFLGTFLEGETVLVAAGYAAHRGLLKLTWVIVIAFLGATLGDQVAFLAGRRYGDRLLARFPALQPRAAKVRALLNYYHTPLILAVRFLYGLRIAGPLVIGMSNVTLPRFIFLNMAGALVWAVSVALAGYYFGATLELILVDIRHFDEVILLAIPVAGSGFWLWRRWTQRRH